jgi:integrase
LFPALPVGVYSVKASAASFKQSVLQNGKIRCYFDAGFAPSNRAALKNLPGVSEELYFWKGGDERQFATACDRARRMIARLGDIAKVNNAHPHRFRDTWAKTALLNGTPMRTVQLVLGHKSIRTTEEHHTPFVVEYQEMIDAATAGVAERLIA